MKVYIVMEDCWFAIGDEYERQWTLCDIIGVFDSLDKAKDQIDKELKENKPYDYTPQNFTDFMAMLDDDVRDDVNSVLKRVYYARFNNATVITQPYTRNPLFDTYIYYIVEKEVPVSCIRLKGENGMNDKIFNWEEAKDLIELVVRNKSALNEDEAYISPCVGDDADIICSFRIKMDNGNMIVVNEILLSAWGKTVDEVASIASYNSFVKRVPSIVMLTFDESGEPSLKFSNIREDASSYAPYLTLAYKENEANGAASVFLGVLNEVSGLYNDGGDLLLIFTSIHECMIHKIEDERFLDGILEARNAGYEFLRDDERLTDKPYVYKSKIHQIMTYDTYKNRRGETQND